MASLFFINFYRNKVVMDRFLLIAFLCVNWSHLAFSQGRYNLMLFTILVLKSDGSDSAIAEISEPRTSS